MNLYDELLAFTTTDTFHRFDLSKPVLRYGKVCATNGCLLVRVPYTLCDKAYMESLAFPCIEQILAGMPSTAPLYRMPELSMSQIFRLDLIDSQATITPCAACDHIRLSGICSVCDDTGFVRDTALVWWMDDIWNWSYLRRVFLSILEIGSGEFRFHSSGKGVPLFQIGEVEIALMPCESNAPTKSKLPNAVLRRQQ